MGLSNDCVLALYEDREGSLWIGTYAGGLNRLKDGRFTAFTAKEGLSNDTVNVIYEDRAGNLWIGTRGGGLNRYKDGRFTAYTTKDGLSDDLVFALHEDREGSLWSGTYGGGLNRLKNGRFTAVTEKQGLYDDVIHRILEDGLGDVWMSSNKGIFRVPKRELDEVADGMRERVTPVVYGTVDGMKNAECNGGASAGTMTRDGRLWFPTIQGAVQFDPEHLPTNRLPPPVAIEEVLVDGKPVDVSEGLRLPPAAQTLEVHFTALSLVAPEAVRFRYRLEGLEEEWVEADTRRVGYSQSFRPEATASASSRPTTTDSGTRRGRRSTSRYRRDFTNVMVRAWWCCSSFSPDLFSPLPGTAAHAAKAGSSGSSPSEPPRSRRQRAARAARPRGRVDRRPEPENVRRDARRRCRRACRLQTPLALMLLDIDAFKAYNDRHGHQAGDSCLRAVARAVAAAHRRAGELVARYGGEELAVIVPGVQRENLAALAENLRLRVLDLALPHPDSTVAPFVTVSVGAACAEPDVDVLPQDLVAAADRALYLAKQRGRNRVEINLEVSGSLSRLSS
jgi:diguanylate cyclase (GGDEF)-like protein